MARGRMAIEQEALAALKGSLGKRYRSGRRAIGRGYSGIQATRSIRRTCHHEPHPYQVERRQASMRLFLRLRGPIGLAHRVEIPWLPLILQCPATQCKTCRSSLPIPNKTLYLLWKPILLRTRRTSHHLLLHLRNKMRWRRFSVAASSKGELRGDSLHTKYKNTLVLARTAFQSFRLPKTRPYQTEGAM